eukprot:scaffold4.g5023.t1
MPSFDPRRGTAAALATAREYERQILLEFKHNMSNWEEVAAARGLHGWTECLPGSCLPVCTWGGVQCAADNGADGNHVTTLDLSCSSCTDAQLRGRLTTGLARLERLMVMDLSSNLLFGPLPPAWGALNSFPSLLQLNLNSNQLTGPFPEEWSVGAFQQLEDLQIASNQLSGPFPASFAVASTSFAVLKSMNFGNNRFHGPLPSYINGMITMSMVALNGNQFTGTLPPDWGRQGQWLGGQLNNTQALAMLYLHDNRLSGTLPPQWAGADSFTALQLLTLHDNLFSGGLPAAWGASPDALPQLEVLSVQAAGLGGPLPAWGPAPRRLRTLSLAHNELTGSFPPSWALLSALMCVGVQPGNPGLCPSPPPNAAFRTCVDCGALCRTPNASACEPPAPSGGADDDSSAGADGGPASGAGDGGGGFPVAAVVGPVAAAAAAATTAGLFLWRRRWRRGTAPAEPPPRPSAKDDGAAQYNAEDGGGTGTSLMSDLHCLVRASADPKSAATTPERLPSSASASPRHSRRLSLQIADPGAAGSGAASAAALRSGPSPRPIRRPSGGSGGGERAGSGSGAGAGGWDGSSSAFSAHELQSYLSDWQIDPAEITILKRPDGTDWMLGSGGFGTVYKAVRNGVQPVAVKVLTAGGDVSRIDDTSFAGEISILRACRDANILQFAGACVKDGRLCLVTEYLEGGSLGANLRFSRVTWYKRGKRIALDLARALVYLHSKKIVHLDVKSANVLLARDGTAKLGDVGMARIIADGYITGVVGTLAWSAPEMLWGTKCTAKADVYSFGVVLWEIATGETPVRGQLRDPVVPEECPAELCDLIARCLDADPDVRPSAVELVTLLTNCPATPPGSGPGAPSPGGSFTSAVLSPGGSFVSAGGGGAPSPGGSFTSAGGGGGPPSLLRFFAPRGAARIGAGAGSLHGPLPIGMRHGSSSVPSISEVAEVVVADVAGSPGAGGVPPELPSRASWPATLGVGSLPSLGGSSLGSLPRQLSTRLPSQPLPIARSSAGGGGGGYRGGWEAAGSSSGGGSPPLPSPGAGSFYYRLAERPSVPAGAAAHGGGGGGAPAAPAGLGPVPSGALPAVPSEGGSARGGSGLLGSSPPAYGGSGPVPFLPGSVPFLPGRRSVDAGGVPRPPLSAWRPGAPALRPPAAAPPPPAPSDGGSAASSHRASSAGSGGPERILFPQGPPSETSPFASGVGAPPPPIDLASTASLPSPFKDYNDAAPDSAPPSGGGGGAPPSDAGGGAPRPAAPPPPP